MRRATTITHFMVASVLFAMTASSDETTPSIHLEATDQGFWFKEGERRVMFYQREPVTREGLTRANFVHPVFGLDGEELTEIFPADHRHHQGVFWAWHQLHVGETKVGDPWITKDFLTVVKDVKELSGDNRSAALRIVAHWTSPLVLDDEQQPMPIVEETTTIRLHPSSGDSQAADFIIRLKPLLPAVRIGGAENSRGYSGFTVRVKPPREMELHTEGGKLSEDGVGVASRWADVSGLFGSRETPSGIAILSHPSLVKFPPRWLLRHYGMQNVVYPGRDPIELSADQPLVLRHRLLIHRGDAAAAGIPEQQSEYAASE